MGRIFGTQLWTIAALESSKKKVGRWFRAIATGFASSSLSPKSNSPGVAYSATVSQLTRSSA
eukprot:scaffold1931_cov281-Chaetoceros_neogracile.AAC.7